MEIFLLFFCTDVCLYRSIINSRSPEFCIPEPNQFPPIAMHHRPMPLLSLSNISFFLYKSTLS